MYHGIDEPADAAEGARYTVTALEFARQLEEMAGSRLPVLRPDRIADERSGLVLTFDDGEASVARHAFPRLERRGIRAALFMTTAWLGRRGFLDRAALRELHAAGWLIGSHGHTHRFLSTLGSAELHDELRRSRDTLAELLGAAPRHLSFPGGRTSSQVEGTAKSLGFTTFWSSMPGINRGGFGKGPIRRTVVRRGESIERFRKLVQADPFAHALDTANMQGRGLVRKVLGDDRYHGFTGQVLAALGRR